MSFSKSAKNVLSEKISEIKQKNLNILKKMKRTEMIVSRMHISSSHLETTGLIIPGVT